nr:phosphoribosylformylglycinamidine synthase subunit PurS [Ruficoccus amylovorans]
MLGRVKITVFVTPKKNVLDPQGAAVGHAMHSLGFTSAANVRVGKTVEFEVEGQDTPEFRASLDKLCQDLLSNPVIEDFRYEIGA